MARAKIDRLFPEFGRDSSSVISENEEIQAEHTQIQTIDFANLESVFRLTKAVKAVPLMDQLPPLQHHSSIVESINSLIQHSARDDAITVKQSGVIYEHFKEPLDAIANNHKPDMKIVAQTKDELNQVLHHASGMNPKTHIALGAAIGAVMGLGLFLGIGILTAGTGTLPTLALIATLILAAEGTVIGGLVGGAGGHKYAHTVNPALSKEYKESFTHAAKTVFATQFKPAKPTEQVIIGKDTQFLIPPVNNSPSSQ